MLQHPRHWIRSHHVWRETAGRFEAAAILIENDRVTAVELFGAPPADDPIREFGERFVLPGLLNTHVHLDFSGSRTPLADFEAEDPGVRLLRATTNAATLLRSGVTTVRDCGSHWTTLALARRPDLSPVPLPRLLLSGPPITPPHGHLHFMDGTVRNDLDIFAHIARLRKEGGRSVKVMVSGGQMTPGSKPEDTVFDQRQLDLITAEARHHHMPSVGHVLATESVRRAAIARFDSLEHCAFFQRHDDGRLYRRYDDEIARILRDSGSAMMANLSTAMPGFDEIYGKPEPARTVTEKHSVRQFEQMVENFGRLLKLGIPMVCGNDAGVSRTPFDSTWMELDWMIRGGQSPVEALRSATVVSARALLIDDEVGRIDRGYSADIIAVAGDPLQSIARLGAPLFVMRQGEVVVEAGMEQAA